MRRTPSLAFRHLLAIILVSLVFSAAAVAYQFGSQFAEGKRSRNEVLQMIEEGYLPPLSSAAFYFEERQLQLLLEGIVLLPYIETAEVAEYRPEADETIAAAGSREDPDAAVHQYELIYEHGGETRPIGSLQVTSSLANFYDQLGRRLRRTAMLNLLQIFAFAFAILYITRRMILRHVAAMTEFFREVEVGNLAESRLELQRSSGGSSRGDELDQITAAINAMITRIEFQLEEKETLIRELYHRTNNTMQVVMALLEYRRQAYPDSTLDQFVEGVSGQIQAMALVQQQLYRAGNLSSIDLGDYLRSLTAAVQREYPSAAEAVSVSFDLQPVRVLLDSAVPAGLAVNELIISAFSAAQVREAGPAAAAETGPSEASSSEAGPSGTVPSAPEALLPLHIACSTLKNGEIEIRVRDHGNNCTVASGEHDAYTGGLGLAAMLVKQQLSGTITLEENGTACVIRFRDNLYEKRIRDE